MFTFSNSIHDKTFNFHSLTLLPEQDLPENLHFLTRFKNTDAKTLPNPVSDY